MNPPTPPAATHAWARHLAAPAPESPNPLTPVEALRVQRYHDRLLAALRARDRTALHDAKQAVLRAAYGQPSTPALRGALRMLAWQMVALLPPRRGMDMEI